MTAPLFGASHEAIARTHQPVRRAPHCPPRSERLSALTAACGATAALLVIGCTGADKDPVILRLGEQVVRQSEYDAHLLNLEARGEVKLEPALRQALLAPFVEERVLVLEARARGWLAPGKSSDLEQAAVHRLLDEEVFSKLVVKPEEETAYYRQHTAEFALPERVTLRQILVGSEGEARDVVKRLLKDPQSFDTLARTRSRGPEAETGGLMGDFSPGQLPADLEQAAFALLPGHQSDVVKTSLGFHVLRVDARAPARESTLEEARGAIRSKLLREKSDAAVRQFVQGLLARAKVNDAAGS